MSDESFCKVAMHPDGLHLLALTREGETVWQRYHKQTPMVNKLLL